MSRWALYVLGLAALVVVQVAALEYELHDRWIIFAVSLAVALAVALIEARRFEAETRDREYRRSYEASRDATYTALCGAIADLGYRTAASDRTSARVTFRTGPLDLLMPRPSLECEAIVRQLDPSSSEVVLSGVGDGGFRPADGRVGYMRGAVTFPRGTGVAARRILDRVDATVVTYRELAGGTAQPTRVS